MKAIVQVISWGGASPLLALWLSLAMMACSAPLIQSGGSVCISQGDSPSLTSNAAPNRASVNTQSTETRQQAAQSHFWFWLLAAALGGVALVVVIICLFTNQTPLSLLRAAFKLLAI